MLTRSLITSLVALTIAQPLLAADPEAGRQFFGNQCGLCHSAAPNDNGGAQGPSLIGVMGRPAASAANFPYTQALKNAAITWDATTLDHFLSNPAAAVPGSAMVIPVPDAANRENVIAYFQALSDGSFQPPAPPGNPFAGMSGPRPAAPPPANADWKLDAPGRVHKLDLDKLPAPYATESANNFPQVLSKPANAELKLPAGFKAEVFAADLQAPRAMIVAANGDILLAETLSGRVKVMRPSADGSKAQTITVFAQGLVQPLGMALYPSAAQPQWLYVAENNRVVRYPYTTGDTVASGVPEVVVPQLAPTGGGHYTRDLAFSLDGKRMFVSVGSQANIPENLPVKSPAEIVAWEAAHGLGAPWGEEENRAAVLVFDVGSSAPGKLFATGIRNCVGMTVQPANGALWCTTNERDMLGDDLVPDYATRVVEGGFYGWPWYYMGDNEDPRLAGQRPDLVGKVLKPDVPFTAHSAAVDIAFYPATVTGKSAFPAEYAGEGFAVLHGSWNRALRTGHKIVRIPMQNGVPTGEYIDFMVGFITDDGPWGRPVAITVAQDGSLLLSDDSANVVYRISYSN